MYCMYLLSVCVPTLTLSHTYNHTGGAARWTPRYTPARPAPGSQRR